MYRQYENPYRLEKMLKEAKREDKEELNNGADEGLMSLAETIADLEERVNFAWQDDEEE